MTYKVITFTGTDGADVTDAGIGASNLNLTGGSTARYSSAAGVNGTGLRIIRATGQTAAAQIPFVAPNTQGQVTVDIETPPAAHASGTVTLYTFRHASGTVGRIVIGATGNIAFLDSASVGGTLLTGASWGTKYRVAIDMEGGSTSAGKVDGRIYPSGSDTATGVSLALTAANLTVNALTHVQLGDSGGSASVTTGYDNLQMNDGAGTFIPRYTPTNVLPTVNAGVDQNVASGATVNLSASGADSDGTIASVAWTWDYLSSGSPTFASPTSLATTVTVPATAGFLGIARCTVTDNSGGTAFDTVEIRVPVAGATEMRPLAQDGVGSAGWTIVGGSATEGAAMADESDSTYVQSPAISSTPAPKRWRYQPSGDKTNPFITLRLGMDSGTGNWVVRIFDAPTGGTAKQEFTQNGVTTTPTNYSFNITATLTSENWKGVWVEAQVVTP